MAVKHLAGLEALGARRRDVFLVEDLEDRAAHLADQGAD
jgi:hypothetical protein